MRGGLGGADAAAGAGCASTRAGGAPAGGPALGGEAASALGALERRRAGSRRGRAAPSEPASGHAAATHFLLYLNDQTYLGEAGAKLAVELRAARDLGLPVVMVHENDPARNGCPFSHLFKSTPQDLVADDLYYATALALFPGPLWSVSVAMVAQALGATLSFKGHVLRAVSHEQDRSSQHSSEESGQSERIEQNLLPPKPRLGVRAKLKQAAGPRFRLAPLSPSSRRKEAKSSEGASSQSSKGIDMTLFDEVSGNRLGEGCFAASTSSVGASQHSDI